MDPFYKDLLPFFRYLVAYNKRLIWSFAHTLEGYKNDLVDLLMFKRGIFQKKVWHGSMITLSAFGVLTSGIFGGQTIISSSFPGIEGQDPRYAQVLGTQSNDPVLNSLYDTHTTISQKPRSEILNYEVQSGDTLSSIANRYDVSIDTIKWANGLNDTDTIKPGDILKILPVSGVSHTVVAGDTIESVAKKYSASSQGILDFPFNDIGDDLKLKVGQTLIVPDGVPPTKAPVIRHQPQAVAQQTPSSSTYNAPGGGSFIWPTVFAYISTYFAWWHPGIDLPHPSAPPIVASDGGTVIVAGWPDYYGYGNRVMIDHGNGYQTLYAHLSNIYVTVGQKVSRGQTIGQMGNTGRSTGTHLHFEIRYKGVAVNPLAILK